MKDLIIDYPNKRIYVPPDAQYLPQEFYKACSQAWDEIHKCGQGDGYWQMTAPDDDIQP